MSLSIDIWRHMIAIISMYCHEMAVHDNITIIHLFLQTKYWLFIIKLLFYIIKNPCINFLNCLNLEFLNFSSSWKFEIISSLAPISNRFLFTVRRYDRIVPDMLHPNLYRHIVSHKRGKTLWLRDVILFEIQKKLIIQCSWHLVTIAE